MKRTALLLALAAALTSCAQFDNGVFCSVDGSDAAFLSRYYRLHIGSDIKREHAEVICERFRQALLRGERT